MPRALGSVTFYQTPCFPLSHLSSAEMSLAPHKEKVNPARQTHECVHKRKNSIRSGFLGPGLAPPRLVVILCVLKRLGGRKEEQCKLNYLYRTLSSRECSHRMTLRARMPPQGLWTYSNSKGTFVFVFAREKGITWKLFLLLPSLRCVLISRHNAEEALWGRMIHSATTDMGHSKKAS